MVFGVISPNISRMIVTNKAAILIPEFPKRSSAIVVTTADNAILTLLLPMRSVFSN